VPKIAEFSGKIEKMGINILTDTVDLYSIRINILDKTTKPDMIKLGGEILILGESQNYDMQNPSEIRFTTESVITIKAYIPSTVRTGEKTNAVKAALYCGTTRIKEYTIDMAAMK
jgi:hypothetical protein